MARQKQSPPDPPYLEIVAEIVGRAPALTDEQRARVSGLFGLAAPAPMAGAA
jgi:hypothetical protein